MTTSLNLRVLPIALLFLVGCERTVIMAPIGNFYDEHAHRELTLDQMTTAIKSGAVNAGWRIGPTSNNQILAIYRIRKHTVIVTIDYSSDGYSIVYRNSFYIFFFFFCYDNVARPTITTGGDSCPDGAAPTFIHKNYNEWVQKLNNYIKGALRYSRYIKGSAVHNGGNLQ